MDHTHLKRKELNFIYSLYTQIHQYKIDGIIDVHEAFENHMTRIRPITLGYKLGVVVVNSTMEGF